MGKTKKLSERAHGIIQGLLPPSSSGSQDKKLQIVEATIRILAVDGIEKVTFESVGLLIGTTKANIRYHFKNKDDLILMAVRMMVLTAQHVTKDFIEKATSDAERLRAVIEGAFQHLREHPDHIRVFMMYFYYASFQSDYRRLFIASRSTGKERLAQILADLPTEKNSCKDRNLVVVADEIQNIITGQLFGVVLLDHSWIDSLARTKKIVSALLASEGVKWSDRS